MQNEIIPAILVDNEEEFKERIEICEEFAEIIQWDIMDGQFVEQMTFSDLGKLKEIESVLAVELHLMMDTPEEKIDEIVKSGADRIIIHVESVDNLEDVVDLFKSNNFEVGVAINPETEIKEIEGVMDNIDEVMVMTVVPGSSGQEFMPEMMIKVESLRQKYPEMNIAVDGGINMETIVKAKEAGANRFCVNSAIFASLDPGTAYELLQAKVG